MEIKEGYLYHISLDFFKLVDDPNLSVNHTDVTHIGRMKSILVKNLLEME